MGVLELSMELDAMAARIREVGYVVVDSALGRAHAQELAVEVGLVEKKAATIAVGLEMTKDAGRRDDRVAWVKKAATPATVRHRQKMEALRVGLEARLDLKTDACSFMAAEYGPMARGYVEHRDAAPERPSGRKLTAIYYLNPEWRSGGELGLWPREDDEMITVAPIEDRLVVFRSSLLHKVLPNGPTPRLALTTWFYNKLELAMELYAERQATKTPSNPPQDSR